MTPELEQAVTDLASAWGLFDAGECMNDADSKWVAALRLFMGDGTGPVPVWTLPDGTIDATKTVTAAFGLYNIKPR